MAKYLSNIPKINFSIEVPSKYDVAKLSIKGLAMDFEMKLRGAFVHLLNAKGDRQHLYKTFVSGINKTTNICVGYKSVKDIVNTSEFIALFYEQ